MLLGFVLLAYCWCWAGDGVQAYIPATPSNDTSTAIASGLNLTDVSNLYLQWYKNGWVQIAIEACSWLIVDILYRFYTQTVSYELVKTGSDGISKGALVHFSEAVVRNDSSDLTTTPWIALVACDFNATHASQEDDIFTLARDRGAVGALLYSEWSQACIVNPEYADPNEFEQVMDIYSTQSLSSARQAPSIFAAINVTVYGTYDPQRLNESQSVINDTLQAGYPTAPGYLWATLAAWNATADPGVNSVSPGNGGGNGGGGGGSPKTTLAMIILYAITGCVSAMFCVVIITGVGSFHSASRISTDAYLQAIRAIRHPERYRVANMTQGGPGFGEGRGGVLARAVLDTFPIIKFGRDNPGVAPKDSSPARATLAAAVPRSR
ncbi:hypothetical protein EWM64_g7293 [Hericium alpestre]|uniref:Uncharacterized protein n=1 Tax=Hericium alpestre TaxID=135208 RepID=A0A4Y9ZR58_9AGAM|nr:hypothetical protein EWM64_g7293 [Hericium alpestre]